MKALFLTTRTNDCSNHVRAWDSVSYESAVHLTYEHRGGGIKDDQGLHDAMVRESPDVMFWIGANSAPGNPKPSALRAMRSIAPFVNLVSDAADRPWWSPLKNYAKLECFDLQVALDGGVDDFPVEVLRTLTPVDARPFAAEVERDVQYGFSGSVGRGAPRSEIIRALEWFKGLHVRPRAGRAQELSYDDHARFMRRCQVVLNFSWTGTGHTHHVKGRVLEAGFAGCALLEHECSPIGDWFPEECFIRWRDVKHIAELVENLDDATIARAARRLAGFVRSRYGAARIYSEILEKAGVDLPLSRPAT